MADQETTNQNQTDGGATDVDKTGPTTSAGSKNADNQPGPVPYERFKEVNDQLADLKKFKVDWEKQQSDAKKQADAAEAARLAEQGKYKELADQANAKAAELEPFKTKAERYEGALGKLLTKEREGLPKHVTVLLDKLDPAEQLEYIAEHRAEFGRKDPPPNVNAKDGQGGKPTTDPKEREQELRQRFHF